MTMFSDNHRELLRRIVTQSDDGAAYELILVQYRPLLCKILVDHNIPQEAHYDLLMDFYLYLRDGNHDVADQTYPFAMLMSLNSPDAFPTWLKVVFSRWLNRRIGAEAGRNDMEIGSANLPDSADDDSGVGFTNMYMAVLVIEEINMKFSAPERLVFFSDLFALCTHRPSASELQHILQTTPGNVRVIQSRVRKKAKAVARSVMARYER